MKVKKVFLNWNEVYHLLDQLYEKTQGKINHVTGIPRGGTILAILYSHRFNVSYTPYMSNHYSDLLILDDIADTGVTFEEINSSYPNPKKGALMYKSSSTFKPDFYGEEIPDDYGWIVFPWEREDSETIQDYLV